MATRFSIPYDTVHCNRRSSLSGREHNRLAIARQLIRHLIVNRAYNRHYRNVCPFQTNFGLPQVFTFLDKCTARYINVHFPFSPVLCIIVFCL
jgi:hypothetical protein